MCYLVDAEHCDSRCSALCVSHYLMGVAVLVRVGTNFGVFVAVARMIILVGDLVGVDDRIGV